MHIIELYVRGFGKIKDRQIVFDPYTNIIYGENEAGKSTIHNFIRAMFYGLERARGRAGKTDMWSRYEPWDKSSYGGYIRLFKGDTVYRLERDFSKTASRPLVIVNETLGVDLADNALVLSDLLNGLSLTAYTNTISIGQLKSVTDASMANELRNYIANMNNTGNEALNISKASTYLKSRRRAIASGLVDEAGKAYTSNLTKLQDLEKSLTDENFNEKNEDPAQANLVNTIAKYSLELDMTEKFLQDSSIKLKNSYFHSPEEVSKTELEFKNKLNEYNNNYKQVDTGNIRKLCIGLSVVSLITAVLSLYMFFSGQNNLLTKLLKFNYDVGLALLVIICILSTISLGICFRMLSSKNSHKNFAYTSLSLLIESITGIKEVDAAAIQETADIIRQYKQLFIDVDQAKEKREQLKISLSTLLERQKNYAAAVEDKQKKVWEIEKTMEHISNIRDENIALKKIIEENSRINEELMAIDLALETLTKLSGTIKDSFGFYLNKEASKFISKITGGIYNSISVDKDMNVSLNTSSRLVPIEQLSSGTMDQVYLAIRLASATLMQKDDEKLPLILDDSFVNYDSSRLSFSLDFLCSNYGSQILVFTCHRREAKILSVLEQNYNLIEV